MDPKSVTQYGRPLGNGETTHFGETGARNVQVKGHEHGLVRKEKTFMHMMDVWIQLRTRHLRTRGPLRTRQGRCAEVIHCLGKKLSFFLFAFEDISPYVDLRQTQGEILILLIFVCLMHQVYSYLFFWSFPDLQF